jgi:hypothetical protein
MWKLESDKESIIYNGKIFTAAGNEEHSDEASEEETK